MIVATLLLIMEEEDTFWMMVGIIEDYLPPSYYSPSLIGVQADQFVLRGLLASHLPGRIFFFWKIRYYFEYPNRQFFLLKQTLLEYFVIFERTVYVNELGTREREFGLKKYVN